MTTVGDGDVRVALSRAQIGQLPDLPRPEAALGAAEAQDMVAAFENATLKWPQQM